MEEPGILEVSAADCSLDPELVVVDNSAFSLDRICRTCLAERIDLQSIYNAQLDAMLMACASVQVHMGDGLPGQVCMQCVVQISRAYSFKQQAENSDCTLRQYVGQFTTSTESTQQVQAENAVTEFIDTMPNVCRQPAVNAIVKHEAIIKDEDIGAEQYDTKTEDKSTQIEIVAEVTKNIPKRPRRTRRRKSPSPSFESDVAKSDSENGSAVDDTLGDPDYKNNSENALKVPARNKLDCRLCGIKCNNTLNLTKHMRTHGVKNICRFCHKDFTENSEFVLHMRGEHGLSTAAISGQREHKCNLCGRLFRYKICLKTHLRSHGIGEKKHQCVECGKRFYESSDLVIHVRGHTGERPVICAVCDKRFADPRSLAKHNKIHLGEKNYECDICHKRFIHSYTLTAHRRIHTGEKPYVCSTCGHACATSTQLTLHTRTHTREKPYVCPQCPKTFASRSGLSTHQMTHTGERKHMCSICGKGARTSTDLASHMRVHTGEKPYACKLPECTKRYKTHSQLSAHMRTHTGEKKHVCKTCGKAFADTSQLKSHANIHTGLKPYVCTKCGHRFTQSGSLYTHMKGHNKRQTASSLKPENSV